MGKQLVQVWDVEPAAGKVGALTRKPNTSTTGHVRGTTGKLTISRSNVGYRIESNTWTGSGESRGEGAAHEWGSARVEKAKLEEQRMQSQQKEKNKNIKI